MTILTLNNKPLTSARLCSFLKREEISRGWIYLCLCVCVLERHCARLVIARASLIRPPVSSSKRDATVLQSVKATKSEMKIPLGKNWLNQLCFHIILTQKISVMTLNQRGKLIGFAKSN